MSKKREGAQPPSNSSKLPAADLTAVWRRYKDSRDPALRNTLIEEFLPLVKYNAERIGAKLPDEVEKDDLMTAGIFGLMDAIDDFDLERGVKFATYCAPRIRGAILDELSSMDWVPRLVRSRTNKLNRVTIELEGKMGRAPTEREIAERLGLSQMEFDKLLRDVTATEIIPSSGRSGGSDSTKDVSKPDVIQENRGKDPVAEISKKDLKDLLTRGLTRTERLILVLYYYEEMTMKQIGAALDLSGRRVSQIHSAILKRLKTQLEKHREELIHAPVHDSQSEPAPQFAIVWDAEAITDEEYLRLSEALGDIVRAEGGAGIERIRSQGYSVPVGSGVLQ